MMLNRTNLVLGGLLLLVIAANYLMRVDHSRPNIEIMPDMKYSPAASAFAPNSVLPGGQTMQPPPPGTVARGQLPLHYAASKEDAIRAGEELRNPYSLTGDHGPPSQDPAPAVSPEASTQPAGPADVEPPVDEKVSATAEADRQWQASLARGGELYRTFCISCHGPEGGGDGPVARRGFPPPPSLLTGKSREMKDGQLFHILTYGQGTMAPMAAQLDRGQRWDVINFAREMQRTVSKTKPADPAAQPSS